jgi:hypothetical protein
MNLTGFNCKAFNRKASIESIYKKVIKRQDNVENKCPLSVK